jgi:hypothetical protein
MSEQPTPRGIAAVLIALITLAGTVFVADPRWAEGFVTPPPAPSASASATPRPSPSATPHASVSRAPAPSPVWIVPARNRVSCSASPPSVSTVAGRSTTVRLNSVQTYLRAYMALSSSHRPDLMWPMTSPNFRRAGNWRSFCETWSPGKEGNAAHLDRVQGGWASTARGRVWFLVNFTLTANSYPYGTTHLSSWMGLTGAHGTVRLDAIRSAQKSPPSDCVGCVSRGVNP